MTLSRRLGALVLAAMVLSACRTTPPVPPASLVLRGGRIVTVDPATPEVEAMAIRGDTIVALGTRAEIAPHIGQGTEILDLDGQLTVPGLIESHGHFMGLGESKRSLDLLDAKSWDAIVELVGQAARQAKPGDWILGRGWHQEKWTSPPEPNVEGFPLHTALSAAAPDNPVYLTHASGHASFVNAKAMELAGIDAKTANPLGGEILKDRSGRPIGVLRETASGLASRALERWRGQRTREERLADARQQVELASREAIVNGITSFHDAGVPFDVVDVYKDAVRQGILGVRLWVMVRDTNERIRTLMPAAKVVGLEKRLTVAALKKSIDGALGSRGAWLLEPYADLPGHTGLNTTSVAEVEEAAQLALAHDLQLGVHAIGDRANREVLNIYEAAIGKAPDRADRRWRIEHAQHLHPNDIPRFAQLGVIAAMQGIHCTSDAPYVLARLGPERARSGAYLWRTLIDGGAVVTNGTDVPVERIDPIASFYASVTRRSADGTTFFPDQRMTRDEALRSYTANAAFAAKEDAIKGSLTVGKLADVTVLSKDILTVPDEEIRTTRVTFTIVGGRIVYRSTSPLASARPAPRAR